MANEKVVQEWAEKIKKEIINSENARLQNLPTRHLLKQILKNQELLLTKIYVEVRQYESNCFGLLDLG